MSRRGGVRLLPLTCPTCGRNLPALPEDVAFVCLACRLAVEAVDGEMIARPLAVVPAPSATGTFHLPVWRFAPAVRVPAFNTREILPLIRRFSGRELGEEPGAPAALLGATLPSGEAWLAACFAGVARGPLPADPAILALPFLDEGNRLLETATGARLYKETLDRAGELIAAARGEPTSTA